MILYWIHNYYLDVDADFEILMASDRSTNFYFHFWNQGPESVMLVQKQNWNCYLLELFPNM